MSAKILILFIIVSVLALGAVAYLAYFQNQETAAVPAGNRFPSEPVAFNPERVAFEPAAYEAEKKAEPLPPPAEEKPTEEITETAPALEPPPPVPSLPPQVTVRVARDGIVQEMGDGFIKIEAVADYERGEIFTAQINSATEIYLVTYPAQVQEDHTGPLLEKTKTDLAEIGLQDRIMIFGEADSAEDEVFQATKIEKTIRK